MQTSQLIADDCTSDYEQPSAFFQMLRDQRAWHPFPYGEWLERDGSKVIFDGRYRPICCVFRDGRVEIVPPETWIEFTSERWYHLGFGPSPDAETRAIVVEVMQAYGLESELRRRRELDRQGLLPARSTNPRDAARRGSPQ